jgi:hypothetical protein
MRHATPDEMTMASILLNRHDPLQPQQIQALRERLEYLTDDKLIQLIRTGKFPQEVN